MSKQELKITQSPVIQISSSRPSCSCLLIYSTRLNVNLLFSPSFCLLFHNTKSAATENQQYFPYKNTSIINTILPWPWNWAVPARTEMWVCCATQRRNNMHRPLKQITLSWVLFQTCIRTEMLLFYQFWSFLQANVCSRNIQAKSSRVSE